MTKYLLVRITIVLLGFSVLITAFQNCSRVQFVSSNAELKLDPQSICAPPKIEINNTCQTPVQCDEPASINIRTNTCSCDAPNLQINGTCQPPKTCSAPAVLNFLDNSCVCNSPNTIVNGVCTAPTNCTSPGVLNTATNTCTCNSPNLLINGACQVPVSCTSPSVLNTTTNTCTCNSPNLLINGVCQVPVSCTSPSVLNTTTNTCICNSPNLLINGVCQVPVSCTSPSVLNTTTNTCTCNSPNLLINGVCQVPTQLNCSGGRVEIPSNLSEAFIPEDGVCYYRKLISKVPTLNSCDNFPFSELNYDATSNFYPHEYSSACTTRPRTISQGSFNFRLASNRKIWVSGDIYGQQRTLYVDNFLIFKFVAGSNEQYWAGGSADSFFLNATHPYNIKVNGVTVPFYEFGSSGTVAVTPPLLTSLINIQPNITYNLSGYAQDSGAIGNVSDVYIIFE
jgi:hypothetical protein